MESTLGKRITANRKRLGLTQDQLAEKLGITAQAVSKWENDLSCPDISIFPKLADIFCVTTDELLGRENPAPSEKAEVCVNTPDNESGFSYDIDTGKMDLHWEGAKLDRIGFACWILLTGVLFLIVQLQHIDVSFWNLCWPSFLLIFGIFGIYPNFSVVRLGCGLVGCYFLMEKLHILTVTLNTSILIAVVILLFGVSLLIEALRKNNRHRFFQQFPSKHGKMNRDYFVDGDHFTFDASFGSSTQLVQMDKLRSGHISVNFGEYIVDLRDVAVLESGCSLHADCSFGELTIQVPKQYAVVPDSSTSFASFEISGHPDITPIGTLHLHADASFGEIRVEYL